MVVQGEDGVVAFTRYHKFQCHEIGSNYPAPRCLQGFIYGNMNNERHLEGTQFLQLYKVVPIYVLRAGGESEGLVGGPGGFEPLWSLLVWKMQLVKLMRGKGSESETITSNPTAGSPTKASPQMWVIAFLPNTSCTFLLPFILSRSPNLKHAQSAVE